MSGHGGGGGFLSALFLWLTSLNVSPFANSCLAFPPDPHKASVYVYTESRLTGRAWRRDAQAQGVKRSEDGADWRRRYYGCCKEVMTDGFVRTRFADRSVVRSGGMT